MVAMLAAEIMEATGSAKEVVKCENLQVPDTKLYITINPRGVVLNS